jgi:UDP-N-acetylglucosamine--N-acetylmuramyl-(pentapeptide) pyrophosphoryl-undecaprenol N-acetylglucosamine transferase
MRRPSVLVPYPRAFGDHQTANAREFEAMGAAELLPQPLLAATTLEARIQSWLHDEGRAARASAALADWDRPAAVDDILALVGVTERAVLA